MKYKIGDVVNIKEKCPEVLQQMLDEIQIAYELFEVAALRQRMVKEAFWSAFYELYSDAE